MQHESPEKTIYLVFEGDWGGQIYLTIPWTRVGSQANSELMFKLLWEMDDLAWTCNDGEGAMIYLSAQNPSEKYILGSMGGGKLTNGLWLHDQFVKSPYWKKQAKISLDFQQ